jgi:prepilin-type N-terminal cleavage/methylation domain-containing protein
MINMNVIKRLQFKIKGKQGFTLVETLIAVAILALALVPPTYTAYQSVISANFAKDQMIANYLAQDAMDYIIAKKNQNIIACTTTINDGTADADIKACNVADSVTPAKDFGRYWLADLNACDMTSNGNNKCIVDTTRVCNPDASNICTQPYVYAYPYPDCTGSDQSCYVFYDLQRKMYRPMTVAPTDYRTVTKFKRYVTIKTLNDHEAQVSSVVTWKSRGLSGNDSITVRTNIYRIIP